MYFSELHHRYLNKWWWLALKGIVSILYSIIALTQPQEGASLLLLGLSLWLLLDGLILMIPLLLGKVTSRLAPIIMARGGIEIIAALLINRNAWFSLTFLATMFGVLVIFRGILAFIAFVEEDIRLRHQRNLLISAFTSFIVGFVVLFQPFEGDSAFIRVVGLYVLVDGFLLLMSAWQRYDDNIEYEPLVTYADAPLINGR